LEGFDGAKALRKWRIALSNSLSPEVARALLRAASPLLATLGVNRCRDSLDTPRMSTCDTYHRDCSRIELASRLLTTASNPFDILSSQRLLDSGEILRM
jgi:hypothetical protein